MTTYYPMPIENGGNVIQQTVHIGYAISGTTVQLTNLPSEGDYSFYLLVSTADCKGHPLQDDAKNNLRAYTQVQFEGDHLDLSAYGQDLQTCLQHYFQQKYKTEMKIPVWSPINYPSPESIIEYLRDVVALGPQAEEILLASKIAHGNSFYRAIFSPAARQPSLLKTTASPVLAQQHLTNIARDLSNLTSSLLNVGNIALSAEVLQGITDSEIKKK